MKYEQIKKTVEHINDMGNNVTIFERDQLIKALWNKVTAVRELSLLVEQYKDILRIIDNE